MMNFKCFGLFWHKSVLDYFDIDKRYKVNSIISKFWCKSRYLGKTKGATSRSCPNLHDKRMHEKGVTSELRAKDSKMSQYWLSNS